MIQAEDGSWVPASYYEPVSQRERLRLRREAERRARLSESAREAMTRNGAGRSVASTPVDQKSRSLVPGAQADEREATTIDPTDGGTRPSDLVHHITMSGSEAGSSGVSWTSEAGEPRHRRGFSSTSLPVTALPIDLTGELRFTLRGLTSGDTVTVTLTRGGSTVGTAATYVVP